MDDPYCLGRMAREAGLSHGDLPSFEDPAHEADWIDGYEAEDREIASQRESCAKSLVVSDGRLARIVGVAPDVLASKIGIPLEKWPGNCFAVACQLNEKLDLGLVPCYGHYRGWVSEKSMFSGRAEALGWCNHGWLETRSGVVVDPTRFVFEAAAPYIFVGEVEEGEYDRGGNVYRAQSRKKAAPFKAGEAGLVIGDRDLAAWATSMLDSSSDRPAGFVTNEELFWLSNLALESMGGMEDSLYSFLVLHGRAGLFPLDNKLIVLERRAAVEAHTMSVSRMRG